MYVVVVNQATVSLVVKSFLYVNMSTYTMCSAVCNV